MESSLTLANVAGLAAVMVIGASIPSVSVLAVAARSAASGFAHGAFVSLGIVVGDLVFILIAIYGLSVLSDTMGSHFALIKYIGGAYLVLLGVMVARAKPRDEIASGGHGPSTPSSFMTGLLITLGDQKAILFYLGFLPAFVDLAEVSLADTSVVLATAVVAVGAPKLVYAFLADRAHAILKNTGVAQAIRVVASGVMIAVGIFLIVSAYDG